MKRNRNFETVIIAKMIHRHRIIILFVVALTLTGCNHYNRILEKVYDEDQAVREWVVGSASLSVDELMTHSAEMERVDSLNQSIVFGILDKEGWPSNLSDKANKAIWIVIDHSDLIFQEKYLDLVNAKAEEGVIGKSESAVLNDRVMMHQGKPQIYGTQIKANMTVIGEVRTMQLYLWPVEKPASLDSLRNAVGLSSIEEYMEESSSAIGQKIIWDKGKTVADFQ